MADFTDEVKQLNVKLDETLKASHAAQKAADEVSKRFGNIENEGAVKGAIEAAEKAAQESQELKTKLDAVEKTAQYLEKMISRAGTTGGDESKEFEEKAHNEICAYLRKDAPMSKDVAEATVKALFKNAFYGLGEAEREQQIKTLIEGVNPNGGYFVRPERSAQMVKRIFESSPMRSICDLQTTTSKSVELIIDDNEAASGGWVGETQSRPGTNTPQIGLLTIPIHEQYAMPKATQTMLDDAGFDLENWLSGKVTRKMSRVENTAFVIGDGSQKPKGFLTYDPWAVNGTYERGKLEQIDSGVAGAITADSLKLLQNSLIEEYQANAVWGIKRASWSSVITLKDGSGAYLLNPESMRMGDSLVLLGKRVVFMHDMPDIANDALAVTYGDFGTQSLIESASA
jgi:HK97 family phage major capsid protein